MARYKAIIEYDGTNYFGWQRQVGLRTIQQTIEDSLYCLNGELPVIVYGAGRTDAGVHALCQVAHFDLDKEREPFNILQCINSNLKNEEISVISVEKTDDDFHARFCAKQRSYKYVIFNRRAKPALHKNQVWWVIRDLNVSKMHAAAQHLVGRHDFSSFRAKGCQALSPIKTIDEINVYRKDEYVYVEISALSFLYHQVRNIVGTLYNVGTESWSEDYFVDVFKSKDRSKAGVTAPASGLYFSNVKY